MNKRFNIILAMTPEGGIALDGKIPWPIDYFFLKKTLGKDLLCGKNTYATLPKLSHRTIIQADKSEPFESYLGKFRYLIGGKILYNIGINCSACNKIYITMVGNYECDLFIPEMNILYATGVLKTTGSVFKYSKHFDLPKSPYKVFVYKNISVDFDYLKLCYSFREINFTKNRNEFRKEDRNKFRKENLNEFHKENQNHLETLSPTITYNIVENYVPLISTKKLFIRGVIEELLFFLRGETDTKILESKNVNIWRGNTSKQFLNSRGLNYPEGEAGPIYGFQWRKQIPYVINELRENPTSRRAIFSAWIPEDIPKMCLPPCHILYQFLIRDGALHLIMFQRSADIFLGLPFNLASCGFLLIIFSHILNIQAGSVSIHIGSAHIYPEHIEAVQNQLNCTPHIPARVKFTAGPYTDITFFDTLKYEDFDIEYQSAGTIKAPLICN